LHPVFRPRGPRCGPVALQSSLRVFVPQLLCVILEIPGSSGQV
jgi:hypothetical protein